MPTFWTILFWFLSFPPLLAQTGQIYPSCPRPRLLEHRVTTHPQNDSAPAPSRDGRWLVFVSDRSGNRDLWLKSTAGGESVPLTHHKAEDYSPAWGPDNRKIYFISTRSDARGDLWELRLNPEKFPEISTELKQVDTYLGYDNDPSCSPDGRWVALTSTRIAGERNIWIIELATENVFPITLNGGESPTWSPDGNWIAFFRLDSLEGSLQTELFVKKFDPAEPFSGIGLTPDRLLRLTKSKEFETSPVWDQENFSLYFLRYQTIGSGVDRPDLEVNPSLLKAQLDSTILDSLNILLKHNFFVDTYPLPQLFQMVPDDRYVQQPAVSGKKLYFTTRVGNQSDIFVVPTSGAIPLFLSAREQFHWADSTFSRPSPAFLHQDENTDLRQAPGKDSSSFYSRRLLSFQAVRDHFPGEQPWSGLAGLELARELVRRHKRSEALHLYRKLLQEAAENDSLRILTQLALRGAESDTSIALDTVLTTLSHLNRLSPALQARILWFRTERLWHTGRHHEAFLSLQRILQAGAGTGDPYFHALILQSKFLAESGNRSAKIDTLLHILMISSSDYWRRMALKELIETFLDDGQVPDTVSILQQALKNYASYTSLSAEIHLWLGKYFLHHGMIQRSLKELSLIWDQFPEEKIAVLQAAVLLKSIYCQQSQPEIAVRLYRQLLQRKDLNHREREYFQKQLWALEFKTAEHLKAEKKFAEALTWYRRLLVHKPEQIAVLKGLIDCRRELHGLLKLHKEYLKRIKKTPNEQSVLFALGYILSLEHPDDRKGLVRANTFLERVINQDPLFLDGYLILSHNYERLEELQDQERQRKRFWLVHSFRVVFAPVIWFYRKITLRQAAEFQDWREKAIALLQTALSIAEEEEDAHRTALLSFRLANNYYRLGESGREKAYRFYRQKMKLDSSFSSSTEKALFFYRLGHCALTIGDRATAEMSLRRAIALYEHLGQQMLVHSGKKLLAKLYQKSGDYDSTIAILRRSLEEEPGQSRPQELVATYRQIALNYLYLENEEQVRRYCRKAFEILNQEKMASPSRAGAAIRLEFLGYSFPIWSLGNLGPAADRALSGFSSEDERASLYTILIRNAARHNDYFQTLRLMKAKLAVFRKQNEKSGQAILLNNIGMMHWVLGNPLNAYQWFELSWTLCRKEKFLNGEIMNLLNLSQVIFSMRNKKSVLHEDLPRLIQRLQKLLARLSRYPQTYTRERLELSHQHARLRFLLWRQNLSPLQSLPPPTEVPFFVSHSSEVIDLLGEFESAEKMARRSAFFRQQALVLKDIGEFNFFVGLLPEARNAFGKALAICRSNRFSELEWRLLLNMAMTFSPMARDSTAIRYLQKARTIVLHQHLFHLHRSNNFPSEDLNTLYGQIITRLWEGRKIKEALEVANEFLDLMKLEQLYQMDIAATLQKSRPLADPYFSLVHRINRLETRRDAIQRSRRGGYRLFYQVVDSLVSLKAKLNRQVENLRRQDPELLALFRPLNLSSEEVQHRLRQNQAVIFYFSTPEALVAWCITSDTLLGRRIKIPRSEFNLRIRQYIQKLRADSLYPETEADYFTRHLLSPFAPRLYSRTEWFIIGENPVSNLPFETLRTDESWVGAAREISYYSSLTDFVLSQRANRAPGNRVTWIEYGAEKSAGKFPHLRLKQVNPLRIDEPRFRAILSDRDVVIIHRPLVFSPIPVLQSYFHFRAPRQIGALTETFISPFSNVNDGFFHLYDLFSFHCRTFVLFSLFPQDSLSSWLPVASLMHSAWRNAGIAALITSRWKIPDKISRKFLNIFLNNLNERRPLDAFSLARKKIQKEYPRPFFWSSFIWKGAPGEKPKKDKGHPGKFPESDGKSDRSVEQHH